MSSKLNSEDKVCEIIDFPDTLDWRTKSTNPDGVVAVSPVKD